MLKRITHPTDRRGFLQQVGFLTGIGSTVVRGAQKPVDSSTLSLGPIHWQRYGYDLQNTRFNPLGSTSRV